MHNLSESYKVISLIRPQVATSTVTGTGVDIEKYSGDALAIVNLGAALTSDETCIVTIETSDTVGGTYTARLTFGTLTGTSDNKIAAGKVDLAPYKFVRAVATIAGTTPSFAIDVVLLIESEEGSATLNSTTAA